MKLTTQKIKELIKEEIEKLNEGPFDGPTAAPQEPQYDPDDPFSGPTAAPFSPQELEKFKKQRAEEYEKMGIDKARKDAKEQLAKYRKLVKSGKLTRNQFKQVRDMLLSTLKDTENQVKSAGLFDGPTAAPEEKQEKSTGERLSALEKIVQKLVAAVEKK